MKKKAILLLLCTAMLSGCGRVDSVDVNSQIDPFEVEQATDEDGKEIELVPRTTALTDTSETTDISSDTVTTSAKTVTVNLVKRTNVTSKSSSTLRTTARVPSNTRPSSTTTATTSATSTSTTTTTATTTDTTTTTTTIGNENPTIVTRDDMSCNITESGINVMVKGEPVQNISFDTSYMLTAIEEGKLDPEYRLNIVDLDFDGNFDLFIPSSDDEFNVYGKFLHFNPITKEFEEWHALSGVETYNTSSAEEGTIVSITHQSKLEYVEITRQWDVDEQTEEKVLRKIQKKEQCIVNDGTSDQVYIKYWKYIDGVEEPEKREKVTLDENGEIISREEVAWA